METCTCSTCGYEWQKGKHGGHSCSERLSKRVAELENFIRWAMENGATENDFKNVLTN